MLFTDNKKEEENKIPSSFSFYIENQNLIFLPLLPLVNPDLGVAVV